MKKYVERRHTATQPERERRQSRGGLHPLGQFRYTYLIRLHRRDCATAAKSDGCTQAVGTGPNKTGRSPVNCLIPRTHQRRSLYRQQNLGCPTLRGRSKAEGTGRVGGFKIQAQQAYEVRTRVPRSFEQTTELRVPNTPVLAKLNCLDGCPMFAQAYMGRIRRGEAPSTASSCGPTNDRSLYGQQDRVPHTPDFL